MFAMVWSFDASLIPKKSEIHWKVVVQNNGILDSRVGVYISAISKNNVYIFCRGIYFESPETSRMYKTYLLSFLVDFNTKTPIWQNLGIPETFFLPNIETKPSKVVSINTNFYFFTPENIWCLNLEENSLRPIFTYFHKNISLALDFQSLAVFNQSAAVSLGLDVHKRTLENKFKLVQFLFSNEFLRPENQDSTPSRNDNFPNGNNNTVYYNYTNIIIPILIGIFLLAAFIAKRYASHISVNKLAKKSRNETTIDFWNTNTRVMEDYQGLYIPSFLESSDSGDFVRTQKLGEGGGGCVYEGTLLHVHMLERNDQDAKCVIKDIKKQGADAMGYFIQEVSIMWMCRMEKRISKMIGYRTDPPCLVMKYYPLGDLDNLIHKPLKGRSTYTAWQALSFSRDCAIALDHIHSLKIVHGDVKPSNFLLEQEESILYAVLTDFGIAMIFEKSTSRINAYEIKNAFGLSIRYSAPELFNKNFITEMSFVSVSPRDVYAFAILTWEILCRKRPWDETSYPLIVKSVCGGARPDICKLEFLPSYDKLKELLEQCWGADYSKRPTMKNVKDMIDSFLEN
jgi:hypothetical protein